MRNVWMGCLVFLMGLSGCVTPASYKWDLSLVKPVEKAGTNYLDERVAIEFVFEPNQIGLRLKNNSDQDLKVDWDSSAFISPGQESSRLIHTSVRLMDLNASQESTTVAPGGEIQDALVPADRMSFVGGGYGYWRYGELFPKEDKSVYVGREFSIFLPLEVGGERREYLFTFKIDNVTKLQQSSGSP